MHQERRVSISSSWRDSELVMSLQVGSPAGASRGPTGARRADRDGRMWDERRHIAIEIIPFQPPSTTARFFVVLFEEEPRCVDRGRDAAGCRDLGEKPRRPRREGAQGVQTLRSKRVPRRSGIVQAIVEEYEAAQEELRAANEEIQSSNEELQSTNEELETTKEEVQSTNEELTTLNEELRHRNQEQVALGSDLSNILAKHNHPDRDRGP